MRTRHAFRRTRGALYGWRTLAAACAIGVLAVAGAFAQDQASPFGRRFRIVVPDTVRAWIGPYQSPILESMALFVFANQPTQVTIKGAWGFDRTITVTPDSARTVWITDQADLDGARPFVDSLNTPIARGLVVEASQPITVNCYFITRAGCEAFTALPVESWGTEYRALALRAAFVQELSRNQNNEEGTEITAAPAGIVVVADQDGTEVSFHAPTDLHVTPDYWVRDTSFMLNAGQSVRVQTHDPGGTFATVRDLTGTRISATKPVGVISGNPRTQGGFGANLAQTATGNSNSGCTVEWLAPTSAMGSTFVYRPFATAGEAQTEELIRVLATSPGLTTVYLSNGYPFARLNEGEFVTYSHTRSGTGAGVFNAPFAIRTDQPAQAMAITGSFARTITPSAEGELSLDTWAPAMATLVPRESWYNVARLYTPAYPVYLENYAIVVADTSAELWLDGARAGITTQAVLDAPFKHARITLTPGSHTLRSVGGRCAAIAYGAGRGYESFKPFAQRKRPEATTAAPHPTNYIEDIGPSYAYPVPGLLQEAIAPDSLVIDRVDRCDSSVVVITRIGPAWTFVPYVSEIDPATVNVAPEITPFVAGGNAGYRIVLRPIDPTLDAATHVTLRAFDGRTVEIPYTYFAHSLAVTPSPLEMLDVPIAIEQVIPLVFTNQRPLLVTPIAITLVNGANGFTLRDLVGLGRPLRNGESTAATLAFTGTQKNTEYHDTLAVTTDCGSYRIPIRARTGPYPIPAITGKDWGRRRVGTMNDSLSFVSNTGSATYRIASIGITADAAGAFALAPPDWRRIDSVPPGRTSSLGIRFSPPAIGPFAATIVLVTTDGDTARAQLLGIGTQPVIRARRLRLGTLCIGDTVDTAVAFASTGNEPITISALAGISTVTAAMTLDTTRPGLPVPFLPRVLAPGDTLYVPVRLVAATAGPISASVGAGSDAVAGDSTAMIDGAVVSCVVPRLTVDDHDFDTVLITLRRTGFVTIRNHGVGDAVVTGQALVGDTAAAFTILSPTPPFVVADGDSVRVQCAFTPATIGLKTASIDFLTSAGPLTARLRGVGAKLIVPAFIRRDYHARPGEEVTIHVELAGRLDTLPINDMQLRVGFRDELLGFLAAKPEGRNSGTWSTGIIRSPNQLAATILPNGAAPDTGAMFAIRFLTRFDLLDRSELPFTIETGLPYLEIVPSPGLFVRDPICGLLERLFTLSAHNFRLEQNIPNPITGSGSIEFEIPFDNVTRLVVYDAIGNEALRVMDEPLKAGVYRATIVEGALPAGMYYYKLTSGELTAMRKMVVQ